MPLGQNSTPSSSRLTFSSLVGGPIGCTFVRKILDDTTDAKILMVEVGSQDDPIIGRHHKNSIKYQKDIDAFVHVIQGALQHVSIPPASNYMSTLGTGAWVLDSGESFVSRFYNPDQKPEVNLPGCAVTRTVGGMATHWTCACPKPHDEERENSPLDEAELDKPLEEAGELLNVNPNEYDKSVRHNLVKAILQKTYDPENTGGIVGNLPLAVKRSDNPAYVTWTGSDTVLGEDYSQGTHDRFDLRPEHRLIGFMRTDTEHPKLIHEGSGSIEYAYIKDLKRNKYLAVKAKIYIVACGAVCTPQVLWNSGFGEYDPKIPPELPALGGYLTEQSLAFCQVVLKSEYIRNIHDPNKSLVSKELQKVCLGHRRKYRNDPIWIPFADPEPQVTMPYTEETPWHTQIHRDAFSYGDVGPRTDPRLVVDLRYFGRQEIKPTNFITFSKDHTDIYGMPQATFNVTRSDKDAEIDQRMMLAMCEAANKLGPFLPGSAPQFMTPGLALHITGTTRIGKVEEGQKPSKEDFETSVANQYSQVHGHDNLYVGGNNVIPDSTACNPTRTSVAYAIKAAADIVKRLEQQGCT
ncbi:pyranose 2-oxidase [Rhizoctonia solani AG-3 Rhs1AP]|uniref:Pyranose 2-oxidase n=2 Tax=Rhizoctonia solani AG-3 TaxID=1086053 RepID=A0A074RW73_9AGAM|nr:pyranose 2-oxidase [Rhizoctonia solani AG-3 Rhs1AP]KEP51341.1 pyranose 2-oxidase [Rhizoctonia solani 123E]